MIFKKKLSGYLKAVQRINAELVLLQIKIGEFQRKIVCIPPFGCKQEDIEKD